MSDEQRSTRSKTKTWDTNSGNDKHYLPYSEDSLDSASTLTNLAEPHSQIIKQSYAGYARDDKIHNKRYP